METIVQPPDKNVSKHQISKQTLHFSQKEANHRAIATSLPDSVSKCKRSASKEFEYREHVPDHIKVAGREQTTTHSSSRKTRIRDRFNPYTLYL